MKKIFTVLVALGLLAASCGEDSQVAQPDDAPTPNPADVTVETDADSDASTESSSTDSDASTEIDVESRDDLNTGTGDEVTDLTYDPTVGLDLTPLPVLDDDMKIGQLSNGLTYCLRSNDSQDERLNLQLVVKSGGADDPDGYEGAAHYLEHMLFNGTERYPKNELAETLRDIGVEIGAHLSAYTALDQTVFELSVAASDSDSVTTAFDVLSQWASSATLNEEDVKAEQGIVYDEYLLTATSSHGQLQSALESLYTVGTPYEGKNIIGSTETIQSMTANKLRELYDTWYRPSNMILVAVGAAETSELERLLGEYFEGISGRGPEPGHVPQVQDPIPKNPELTIERLVFSGVGPSGVSLDWRVPVWPSNTVGGDRLTLIETLIYEMLQNRLSEEFTAGRLAQISPPILGAPFSEALVRYFGTKIRGDDLPASITDFLSVLAGAAEFGFTQSELDKIVKRLMESMDDIVKIESTLENDFYTELCTDHILRGSLLAGAEDARDWYGTLLNDITLEDLDEYWQWIWNGLKPKIVLFGESMSDLPTDESIAAAIGEVRPRQKAIPEEEVHQLMVAPDPVTPLSSDKLHLFEDYDVHEWQFGNGSTVVFVETTIEEDSVLLQARSLGGFSILEPGDSALSRIATNTVMASGIGELSRGQLVEYLSSNHAFVWATIGETYEEISGSSSSDDIEDMFALLHLYHTEPRISDSGLEIVVNSATQALEFADSFAAQVLALAYFEARHPDNPWQMLLPTQEQIDSANSDSLLALYKERFGDVDDLLVVVVGDTDRETIEDLAARYVGTLPSGDSDSYVNRRSPHPAGITRVEVPLEDSSGTGISLYYESPIELTPMLQATLDVLDTVLREQMFVRVREELGLTYVASGGSHVELSPVPTVSSVFVSTGEAQFLDQIYEQMILVINELVQDGTGDSDFAQAKEIVATRYQSDDNFGLAYLMLQRQHINDTNLYTPSRSRAALQKVTAADVQALAKQLFGQEQRIEIIGIPAE